MPHAPACPLGEPVLELRMVCAVLPVGPEALVDRRHLPVKGRNGHQVAVGALPEFILGNRQYGLKHRAVEGEAAGDGRLVSPAAQQLGHHVSVVERQFRRREYVLDLTVFVDDVQPELRLPGIGIPGFHHLRHSVRIKIVVSVEEKDHLPRAGGKAGVERRRMAAVAGLEARPDPRTVRLDDFARAIRRGIVDDYHLDVLVVLAQGAVDAAIEEARIIVVRNDDRHRNASNRVMHRLNLAICLFGSAPLSHRNWTEHGDHRANSHFAPLDVQFL